LTQFLTQVVFLHLTYLYFQIPRKSSDHGGKNGTRHRAGGGEVNALLLYWSRVPARRGSNRSTTSPNCLWLSALSQNNKEASFI